MSAEEPFLLSPIGKGFVMNAGRASLPQGTGSARGGLEIPTKWLNSNALGMGAVICLGRGAKSLISALRDTPGGYFGGVWEMFLPWEEAINAE